MSDLLKRKCIPCEGATPALTSDQIAKFSAEIKGWKIAETRLEKTLTCLDFKSVIATVNEIAHLAEEEGHHPDMEIHGWNKLTIRLSTHAIKPAGGLTENDFILAAKIDALLVEIAA
jgi:4a-hydroxytetrahydrobiopterin dehydratase